METLTKPPEISPEALPQADGQPIIEQTEVFNQGELFALPDIRYNDDRTSAVVAERVASSISRIGSIAERISGRINNTAEWLKSHRTASQVGEDALNSAKETYQRGREKATQAGRMVMASADISKWYVKERGNDIKDSISNLAQNAKERKQQRVESYRSKWQSTKETIKQKIDRARHIGSTAIEFGLGAGLVAANSAVTGANNTLAEIQRQRSERLFAKSVELAEAADKRKKKLPKAS